MTMLSEIQEIKVLLNLLETELTKLEMGKKSSAPASRKYAQSIIASLGNIRKQALAFSKSIPVKSRVTKKPTVDIDPEEEMESPELESEQPVEELVPKKKPRGRPKKQVVISEQ